MKNIYNPSNSDEYILAKDFKDEFENLDLTKVYYCFGLLGYLGKFKVTEKGISCRDTTGVYQYFSDNSKYEFYKINFLYDSEVS